MVSERKTAAQRMRGALDEMRFLANEIPEMADLLGGELEDDNDRSQLTAAADALVTQAEAVRDAVEELVSDGR